MPPTGIFPQPGRVQFLALFLMLGPIAPLAAQVGELPLSEDAEWEHLAEPAQAPSAVPALGDAEAAEFLSRALLQGLPDESMDDVYLLVRERSGLALPQLVDALRSAPADPDGKSGLLGRRVLDAIAYAANEAGLQALSLVAEQDPVSVRQATERLLGYARARRNPFELAAWAARQQPGALLEGARDWVQANAEHPDAVAEWAEMIEKRWGLERAEEGIAADPIVAAFYQGTPPPALLGALRARKQGKRLDGEP